MDPNWKPVISLAIAGVLAIGLQFGGYAMAAHAAPVVNEHTPLVCKVVIKTIKYYYRLIEESPVYIEQLDRSIDVYNKLNATRLVRTCDPTVYEIMESVEEAR